MIHRILESPRVYNAAQWLLGTITGSHGSIEACLTRLIRLQPGEELLDVGCGTGRYTTLFGKQAVGIEPNADYIERARELHKEPTFLVGDAKKLPFPDGRFAATIAVGVFHHIDDGTARAAAAEMVRVLKSGGTAYVVDPVWPGNPLGTLLFWLDRGRNQRSAKELETLLAPFGFSMTIQNIPRSFPYRVAVFSSKK